MNDSSAFQAMSSQERAGIRHELRRAREACLRDAEAFSEVLYVIERLGARLIGRLGALADYIPRLVELGQSSSFIPLNETSHLKGLLDQVRKSRNDAMHQGSVARHMTSRCVELALVLEDALANDLDTVELIMVKHPITASSWQTLASIRQLMLANAFSYLPYMHEGKWYLIADHRLAKYLMSHNRKKLMTHQIKDVPDLEETLLQAADPVNPKSSRSMAADLLQDDRPLLVVDDQGHLVGLVSPADLL